MINVRISEVKMLDSEKKTMAGVYRRPRVSTTINRREVARETRPVTVRRVQRPMTQAMQPAAQGGQPMQPVVQAGQPTMQATQPTAQVARPTMRAAQPVAQVAQPAQSVKQPTAREIKDAAIQKALANAAKNKTEKKNATHVHFGFKRAVLAMACAAAAVFAIVYFVNLNAPNVSLKVAAMQTGIEATYPSYIPRDYSLSDITSENGKITLNFKNSSTGGAFSLVEETSSWDSNALLKNFVHGEYGENYTTIREQGLTIYISGSNATWVNGGIVYKLTTTSGSLTKKQIKTIAVSL